MSSRKLSAHFRKPHKVRGHFRDSRYGRYWVSPHIRSGSFINKAN